MNAFEKIIERLEGLPDIGFAQGLVLRKKAIEIVNEVASEYGNSADEHDLMVVGALPSLYPLQDFEEEAIQRVVMSKSGGGWIPVSERLPERNGWYLVTNQLGVVQQQYWGANHWQKLRDDAVVAWQPLPEPYKESEG